MKNLKGEIFLTKEQLIKLVNISDKFNVSGVMLSIGDEQTNGICETATASVDMNHNGIYGSFVSYIKDVKE